ncbi:MAG: SIMPL domain-containing protein [Myxococcota bacterium]
MLAAGLAVGGWFVGGGIRYFKDAERYVSVKGLAEREVAANLAIWPIVYSVSGNDLSELQLRLESDTRRVAAYLTAQGFAAEEFSVSAPRISDNAPQGGVEGRAPVERYSVETTTILRTAKVAEARRAMERSGALVKEGVRVLRSYEYNTQYFFTDLDQIKPEMIAEATADARRAAEKFAQDSGAAVGGIRRAQQGYFSIEDRDAFSPERKKVRVVTSIDYLLE